MEKKGNIFIIVIIVLVVLIGGFFVFKGGFNSSSNNGAQDIIALEEESSLEIEIIPETEETKETEEVPAAKEFNVIAKQWDFSPRTITVDEGDTVILNIESIDVNHGFVLSTFGISEFLSSGNTVKVEFIADKKGTFSFFCNVQCGSGHGSMRGTLVVQ